MPGATSSDALAPSSFLLLFAKHLGFVACQGSPGLAPAPKDAQPSEGERRLLSSSQATSTQIVQKSVKERTDTKGKKGNCICITKKISVKKGNEFHEKG